MKQSFRALAFTMLAAAPAFAQETEVPAPKPAIRIGTFTIGTDLGLSTFRYGQGFRRENALSYDIGVSPAAGLFVTNNLLIFASLHGSVYHLRMDNWERFKGVKAGAGLGLRYYIGSSVNAKGAVRPLRFFAEAAGSYLRDWQHYEEFNGMFFDETPSSITVQGGAGINYFLGPMVAFESSLSYRKLIPQENWMLEEDESIDLRFGIRVFLNRR